MIRACTFTCDAEGESIEKNKITLTEACRNRGEPVVVTVTDPKSGASAELVIPVKEWNMTFADEFDGTSMDVTKWSGFETGLGNEIQVEGGLNECSVADSVMTMSLRYDEAQERWVYPSISTYGKFQQRFGCFAARIKIPPYSGINTAFWMLSPGSYNGSPLYYQKAVPEWACYEIDFLEISAAWTRNYDLYNKRMQSGIYWKNNEMDIARARGSRLLRTSFRTRNMWSTPASGWRTVFTSTAMANCRERSWTSAPSIENSGLWADT